MDKLIVIQNALINTGNKSVNALYDASDEFLAANTAFDRAIKLLTTRYSWPFATTVENLVRIPNEQNKSQRYPDHAYRLPSNALHLREMFYCRQSLTEYEIIENVVSCPYDREIAASVVRMPADAIWHPMAEEILTLYVEAGCLRALNEDFREANNVDAKIENMMIEARPRVGQQDAARDVYISGIRRARRTRRV